jgi:hypothetical protein
MSANEWEFLDRGGEMTLVSTSALRALAARAVARADMALAGIPLDQAPEIEKRGDDTPPLEPSIDPMLIEKILSVCDALEKRMTQFEARRDSHGLRIRRDFSAEPKPYL